MARFRGPRLKVVRRFQQHLPGLTDKTAERRPYPPGQHGPSARRRKISDFALRLEEKQKVRFNYGVSERQMRSYYRRAKRTKGDTGLRLLQNLETRLDNVAFRSGMAPTIPAARQLVGHGHIKVNGVKVDIPSYQVKAGDVISLSEKARKIPMVENCFGSGALATPSYLTIDEGAGSSKMSDEPQREDIPFDVQENLIIEFYSRVA